MIRRPSHSLIELTLPGLVFSFGMAALIASHYLNWYRWRDAALADQVLSDALDVERERSIQERAYKEFVLERYLAKEMSLDDSVEAYLAIDSRHPILLRILRSNFVGSTDLEREARCIVCLASFNASDPTSKGLLRLRLQSDFHHLFPDGEQVSFSPFEIATPETSSTIRSNYPAASISVASQP